jgi:ribosomal protein S18 acetylase RimI-like enzyme
MIRKAELKDLSDLVRLTELLGYPVSDLAEFGLRVEKLLKEPAHFLLVAEIDGKVHGYIEAGFQSTLCVTSAYVILGLVVDSELQDQGLGGQLIDYLEAEVKNLGIQQIALNSGESRHLAHEFYEKHGYALDHMQKKFVKKI